MVVAFRSRISRVLLAGALTFAGAGSAWLLSSWVVDQSNHQRLNEMAAQLVRRAEMEIDYAVVTLGKIGFAELNTCNATDRSRIAEIVLRRGPVKDIEAFGPDGEIQCASLSDENRNGVLWSTIGAAAPARNDSFVLRAIGDGADRLLRVDWTMAPGHTVAAVLNLDSLTYDVFPPALRDLATADILVGRSGYVAHYEPDEANFDRHDATEFGAGSDRYPIETALVVNRSALQRWNHEIVLAASLLGALLGGLIGLYAFWALKIRRGSASELRAAIQSGEIQPYFQPVFSVLDRSIVGCEVLARWKREDGSFVPPDKFIPLAESCGLIGPLTACIVTSALRQLGPYVATQREFKIAFNFDQEQFVSDGFLENLTQQAKAAHLSQDKIVIELTERQSFESTKTAADIARKAQALGFRIALDDTGAGHNGLSQVQDLPIDIIKIDKKFVDRLHDERTGGAIVRMLVALAQELNKTTVAEGIETQEQLDLLIDYGVDHGQGYLVSRALPALAFLAFVQSAAATPKRSAVKRDLAA